MFSEPDLSQEASLFLLRLGTWNYHHFSVITSFALSLRAWISGAPKFPAPQGLLPQWLLSRFSPRTTHIRGKFWTKKIILQSRIFRLTTYIFVSGMEIAPSFGTLDWTWKRYHVKNHFWLLCHPLIYHSAGSDPSASPCVVVFFSLIGKTPSWDGCSDFLTFSCQPLHLRTGN